MPNKDERVQFRVSKKYLDAFTAHCRKHGIDDINNMFRELGAVWMKRDDLSESAELAAKAESLKSAIVDMLRR